MKTLYLLFAVVFVILVASIAFYWIQSHYVFGVATVGQVWSNSKYYNGKTATVQGEDKDSQTDLPLLFIDLHDVNDTRHYISLNITAEQETNLQNCSLYKATGIIKVDYSNQIEPRSTDYYINDIFLLFPQQVQCIER